MNYIVAGLSWYHVYSVKCDIRIKWMELVLCLFLTYSCIPHDANTRDYISNITPPPSYLPSSIFCMHTKYFSLIELISSIRAVRWLYVACSSGTHNWHMSRVDFMHQWLFAFLSHACSKSDLEEKSRVSFDKWTDSGSNARNRSFWTYVVYNFSCLRS